MEKTSILGVVPVIPSADIKRDVSWYVNNLGFTENFSDDMYAGISRDEIYIHLQWHAGTIEDPVNGGSVVKIFVDKVAPLFNELLERGTVDKSKLLKNTPWNTNEFGIYDLNKNAVFFVEVLS
ncbi:MAG: glyoxalase/bleomycin resistance/extradiol dioxygenase family protein [Flavobacteriaceae bacterium]|nr:glyoxalase/bleomycin resistance/extradiol dioxygenase family protein [Flavobacteriaceae bacterium]